MTTDKDTKQDTDEPTIDEISAEIEALDQPSTAQKVVDDADKDEDKKLVGHTRGDKQPQYIRLKDLEVADNATVNIQKTDKPHSYSWRYGGAGTDCKVYHNNPEELAQYFKEFADYAEDITSNIERIKAAMEKQK